MKPKEILVFGASGQIGRHLIRKLTKNNYKVVAVTRNIHQKGYILKTQANPGYLEIVELTYFNIEKIKSLVEECSICINLIGILFEQKKGNTFKNIHSIFPSLLAKLCKEYNLKHFIHLSALGINDAVDSDYAKSKHQSLGQDFVVTSDNGDIILGATAGHAVISSGHVILDGGTSLTLNAPQITRINSTATDTIKGNYALSAQGGYNLQSGKLSLGSMGEANITTFGNITQTIGGSSEEIIANIPGFGLGNLVAKKIKTALPGGKIVLESSNPLGGIDLNVGIAGASSYIQMEPLGNVWVSSCKLASISLVKPTNTGCCERGFSAVNIIKNFLNLTFLTL